MSGRSLGVRLTQDARPPRLLSLILDAIRMENGDGHRVTFPRGREGRSSKDKSGRSVRLFLCLSLSLSIVRNDCEKPGRRKLHSFKPPRAFDQDEEAKRDGSLLFRVGVAQVTSEGSPKISLRFTDILFCQRPDTTSRGTAGTATTCWNFCGG